MGVALCQPQIISYLTEYRRTTSNPGTDCEMGTNTGAIKNTLYQAQHPSGCCPEASGILYSYSIATHVDKKNRYPTDISFLSINQLNNLNLFIGFGKFDADKRCFVDMTLEEYYDSQIEPPVTFQEMSFVKEMPLDRSALTAIEEAILGPAFAINWSSNPLSLMNPTIPYEVPMNILDSLGQKAEHYDKIIIFCSMNDSMCLEHKAYAAFYNQLKNHPILEKHIVFSVNVCPTTIDDEKKFGDLSINGLNVPFKLYYSSNYPFKSL